MENQNYNNFSGPKQERNMFLFVSSIVMIVFGAISTLVSIILAIGGGLLGGAIDSYGGSGGVFASIGAALGIILLIFSVLYILTGVLGVKNAGNPNKASMMMIIGIIYSVFGLISLISDFSFMNLLALAIPACYSFGAYQLKSSNTL